MGLALASMSVASSGCGGPEYGGVGDARPTVVVPVYDVLLRNNCSESVRIGFGPREPEEPFTLGSGRVERLRLTPQDRVWLETRGEWSTKTTASAPSDGWVMEVRSDCAAIVGRRGPL